MAVGTEFVAGSHLTEEIDCSGRKDLIAVALGSGSYSGSYARPRLSGIAGAIALLGSGIHFAPAAASAAP